MCAKISGTSVNKTSSSFNKTNRPAKSFNKTNKPAKSFNKTNKPAKSFNKTNKPANNFNKTNKPAKSFNKTNKPANNFKKTGSGLSKLTTIASAVRTVTKDVKPACVAPKKNDPAKGARKDAQTLPMPKDQPNALKQIFKFAGQYAKKYQQKGFKTFLTHRKPFQPNKLEQREIREKGLAEKRAEEKRDKIIKKAVHKELKTASGKKLKRELTKKLKKENAETLKKIPAKKRKQALAKIVKKEFTKIVVKKHPELEKIKPPKTHFSSRHSSQLSKIRLWYRLQGQIAQEKKKANPTVRSVSKFNNMKSEIASYLLSRSVADKLKNVKGEHAFDVRCPCIVGKGLTWDPKTNKISSFKTDTIRFVVQDGVVKSVFPILSNSSVKPVKSKS